MVNDPQIEVRLALLEERLGQTQADLDEVRETLTVIRRAAIRVALAVLGGATSLTILLTEAARAWLY